MIDLTAFKSLATYTQRGRGQTPSPVVFPYPRPLRMGVVYVYGDGLAMGVAERVVYSVRAFRGPCSGTSDHGITQIMDLLRSTILQAACHPPSNASPGLQVSPLASPSAGGYGGETWLG
jgi:hypothetical protein